MSSERSGSCWRCGRALEGSDFARGELCPGCRSETRCCRNCELHAPNLNNECREPQTEQIADREKANFCEFFKPRAGAPTAAAAREYARSDAPAKAKFDALFRKRPANQGEKT